MEQPGTTEELDRFRKNAVLVPIMIEHVHLGGAKRLDTLNCFRLYELAGSEAETALVRAVERSAGSGGSSPALPADVFISYCFDDATHVNRLEKWIDESGYSTVRATDFLVGEDWVAAIDGAMRASKLVLAVLSPKYFASFWCYDEYVESRGMRRLVIQVETCDLNEDWRGSVDIDLVGLPQDQARERLCSGVRRRLAGQSPVSSPSQRNLSLQEFMYGGPWDPGLMERLYHPQLRSGLGNVGDGSPLADRKWAARRFERGDY